jgi:hypothetical protein
MAPFRVKVQWSVKDLGPVIKSVGEALAKNIQTRSRADIANSGLRNPTRYVKGLTTKVRGRRGGQVVQVFLAPSFAHVWEYGGTSLGRPLLWMRARPGIPKRAGAFGGRLFRPPGTNVLIAKRSKVKIRGMAGTGQGGTQVMYIGVKSVTHARRFHLRQIAYDEANKLTDIMRGYMR